MFRRKPELAAVPDPEPEVPKRGAEWIQQPADGLIPFGDRLINYERRGGTLVLKDPPSRYDDPPEAA